jgi:hypothetical protein
VFKRTVLSLSVLASLISPTAHAAVEMLAIGSLSGSSAGSGVDLSGLKGILENGSAGNVLGGIGSGLAWAGGNTFLALPDRGPNATTYAGGAVVDNTSSYIARFQTVTMSLTPNAVGAALPFTLTPTLTGTTLFSSASALNYGNTAGLASPVPTQNTANQFFFTGRSDNFAPGATNNPLNARFDPEGIRVSNDGKTVFIADEYGPYVRQFDRNTGNLIKTFGLPASFSAPNANAVGATEISGNTVGRVTNKGMEGLAITPDGKTLVGFMQSPLAQDGGDGGRYNRIITIDIASGATRQVAYDNRIGTKNYNSSEILAINDKQFLVLERDGKGLGDGSPAVIKQLRLVDISTGQDVSNVFGEPALASLALTPSLFLDLKAFLNSIGIADTAIPAKLEGMAFGNDVVVGGQIRHTLWLANDNDFVPGVAGSNNFYVMSFTDADLPGLQTQRLVGVPVPGTLALLGLGAFGLFIRRCAKRA